MSWGLAAFGQQGECQTGLTRSAWNESSLNIANSINRFDGSSPLREGSKAPWLQPRGLFRYATGERNSRLTTRVWQGACMTTRWDTLSTSSSLIGPSPRETSAI